MYKRFGWGCYYIHQGRQDSSSFLNFSMYWPNNSATSQTVAIFDTHCCKSFQPQRRLKQKEVKWITNAHCDRLIPPAWEYYYCFGSISDKEFQTKKQGLLTQRQITVTETLWNICVYSCSQDGSVSVVSTTGWTTEESHLYSCQAWVFSSSKCPGQL